MTVPLIGCVRKDSEPDEDVIDSAIEELPDGKQLIYESHDIARQMRYFQDHENVDRTQFQSKTDSQMCVNCEYFTPLKGAEKYGNCAYIKGGKWVVHSQGWCTKFKHKADDDLLI